MAQVKLGEGTVNTAGDLPDVGAKAPDFKVTTTDLEDVTLADFLGKNIILNIFPSIDTGVCATSVRQFNKLAEKLDNTVVLGVSRDLPFAHKRFCGAEGIENVITTSEFKDEGFSSNYKVKMTDGKLKGLFSRAVVIINPEGKVIYTEQVPAIGQEPDYDKALAALS